MRKTFSIINKFIFYISLTLAFIGVAVLLVSLFDIFVILARQTNEELKDTPLYNSYPITNYIVSSIISVFAVGYFAASAIIATKSIDKLDLAYTKKDIKTWMILSFIFFNIPGGIILNSIPETDFPGYQE